MSTKSHVSVDLVRAALRSENLKDVPLADLRRDAHDYEHFLELVARHGGPVAPTRAIDQMWHLHMLHPVAYYEDCMRLFGRILDHDGGFGMAPEELPVLRKTFERTARLWQKELGVSYVDGTGAAVEKCWHDCQSRCWHACSSKRFDDVIAAAAG